MARQPATAPSKAPAPRTLPFEHAVFTDASGRVLCAFDAAPPPRGHRPVPPAALSVIHRIGADGLLPPRAASLRELIGGFLLSVAGDRGNLHAVFESRPPDSEATRLLRAALDLEGAYAAHIDDPAAPGSTFSGVQARLARTYNAAVHSGFIAPRIARMFVHATIEPRGPGILVVLRLRNFTPDPVEGVSVSFDSPKDFLRPAALYGSGADVDLTSVRLTEALPPGEKLLELRLEPQEPHFGPFNLVFRGPGGLEVPARPLRVRVAVPKLAAPLTDPISVARQIVIEEDDPRDVFRLRYTRAVSPEYAFERVKEAVARERPLALMEFSAPAPAYHEAWYLANVVPGGAPMFVEVAVRGPGRLIEVRIATKSLQDLLGAKAEFRRRIRELLSERFMGKKVVVTRSDPIGPTTEEAAPHLHSTLLLRHMQGEIGAAELWHEMRRTATGGSGEGWQFVAPYAQEMMDIIEPGTKAPRAPRLSGRQAQEELMGGVSEIFTRIMSPIALEQTARMGRPGARLRTGLDRGAEAEAEAAED